MTMQLVQLEFVISFTKNIMMALTLLLGLILLCTGLASGIVTGFQYTNGSVCAGDRVECNCTTSVGVIDWTISYRVLGSSNQSWIHVKTVNFNKARNGSTTECEGYTFTYDPDDNSSRLIFHLNASESILIVCQDGHEVDNETAIITDIGYYARAPTNLTTAFNASGVILEWEDTENNCTSTEYYVTLNSTSTDELMYNTSNTTLHIKPSDLLENVTYTYTVKGRAEKQSTISKPFTLATIKVKNVAVCTANTTDPCKNNSCCANVTLNITLESSDHADVKHPSQFYNISYSSNTGEVSYCITDYDKTKWTGSGFNYNERYHFTITQMNDFIAGEQINNNTTTSEYYCQSRENGGLLWIGISVLLIIILFIIVILLAIIVCQCKYRSQRKS
ncbi:PREDICTED: uncharacterized protein LOC109582346 [Amphimedon queenslandica]|uniref:Fibronectin type-III domain-containing protein n=2 Tax=Amphimedon queenslandica TaxID=400682 RepID=A0AAN0J6B3_AMPQE|nr:PREDICTED: uncharacterized protein LOC109582346 [Amphimedon queenslandica]|eukprot:XP_019852569.1 PREDICTED: uncharacterized protein LOC109582346 [Amphimedon queenslandica]